MGQEGELETQAERIRTALRKGGRTGTLEFESFSSVIKADQMFGKLSQVPNLNHAFIQLFNKIENGLFHLSFLFHFLQIQ